METKKISVVSSVVRITTSNNTKRPIIDDDQLIFPMKALEDTKETTELRQSKIDHTVLMGQFNYASDVKDVVFWHNTWKTLFNRIVVRGPFSDDQMTELRSNEYRIDGHKGGNDEGYFSPLENLKRTLLQY
jgi:hypothetical protein